MGLVIQFAARTTSARKRPKPDRPCEVTIFPGIRYDRRPYGARPEPPRKDAERPGPRRPEGTAR